MAGPRKRYHEAHLSAVQARSQTPSRLPCPHGDHGRPPGPGRASCQGPQAPVGLTRSAASVPRTAQARLKLRSQFIAARKGRRLNGPYFFVEALDRSDGEPPRYGLTVTRKIGNAVVRNRIRRRLREAIRLHAGADMAPGFDYVIVARRDILHAPFEAIGRELSRRFQKTASTEAADRRARSPSASET